MEEDQPFIGQMDCARAVEIGAAGGRRLRSRAFSSSVLDVPVEPQIPASTPTDPVEVTR